MEITLVGTGSLVPIPERGGTSIVVDIADERVLIDCGPKTVYGLMDARIPFGEIETMFFTHHHMDHNASFFHFAFTSWTEGGRESLTFYGKAVIRAAKSGTPEISVVVLTGSTPELHRVESSTPAADEYIEKRTDLQQYIEVLCSCGADQ